MSYDVLAHFIKMGGTVFFTAFFILAIVYALWPKNKARFERAAQLPLNEDDHPIEGDVHV